MHSTTIDPPTHQDIIGVLNRLKNNTSPKSYGIPAELLKHAGSEIVDVLLGVVQSLWNNKTMPVEWMKGALYPLHEKGDKLLYEYFQPGS